MIYPYGYYTLMIGRTVSLSAVLSDPKVIMALGVEQFVRTIGELNNIGGYRPFQDLNMTFVQKQFDRAAKLITEARENGTNPPLDEFKQIMIALFERLEDALSEEQFFHVPSRRKRLYDGTGLIPQEVRDRLGVNSDDLIEAGRCFALGRFTASVFHLMRVGETIVQRLGAELGVTIIDKNNRDLSWGPIIANINQAIEKMPKGPRKQEWSDAVVLLYHVKEAWRNDTMHPKQTYMEEEAAEIFDASGAFARRLAKLISTESGKA